MENKKKKKNLKIIIPIVSVLSIIGIFLLSYFIDTNRFYSNLKNLDTDYSLKITYLVMDDDKVPDDVNVLNDLSIYVDSILSSQDIMVPLKKDGDYLYIDLNGNVNRKLLEKINTTVFSLHNTNGEVINDCEFDSKTKVLKIPYSYYKDRVEDSPIQFELVSEIKKDDFEKLEIKTNIKKLYTTSKIDKQDANTFTTVASLKTGWFNNISKKEIDIYVNGYNKKLSSDSYVYNKETKKVEISMNPILVDRLDIRVNNNLISRVSAMNIDLDPSDMNYIKLAEKPKSFSDYEVTLYNYDNSSQGITTGFHYCGSRGYSCVSTYWEGSSSGDYISDDLFDYDYSYRYIDGNVYRSALNFRSQAGYDDRNNTEDGKKAIGADTQYPFDVDLKHLNESNGKITFTGAKKILHKNSTTSATNLFIPLACIDHPSMVNDNTHMDVKVHMVQKTDDYMIISITTVNRKFHNQVGQAYVKLTWPKAYLQITKKYSPSGDDDHEERIFKLYEDLAPTSSEGRCTSISSSPVATTAANSNTGYVQYKNEKIQYYYLGWKEGDNEALLDASKKYCLFETTANTSYTPTYYVQKKEEDGSVTYEQRGVTGYNGNLYAPISFNNENYNYYYAPSNDVSNRVRVVNSTQANGCIEITKTDGYEKLEGIEFTAYEGSTCSGTEVGTGETDSSGVVTFEGLDTGSYSAKETESTSSSDIEGLKRNDTCHTFTVSSESTSCESKIVKNTPYKITFYKQGVLNDKNDTIKQNLSGVKFKVKASNDSSNYITVSGRDSRYNNCYIYTGKSSNGTVMTTDSSGKICIAKIPNKSGSTSITYTAYEQQSPGGYVFENGKIENIAPDTSVKGAVCTSTECNILYNVKSKIAFYKQDENGNGIANVNFLVKNRSGKSMNVQDDGNGNLVTDSNGCYIYESTETDDDPGGTVLKTNNNGRICISGVPTNNSASASVPTYTAYEQASPAGYVFNNGTITGLTPGKTIQGASCSGSNCNILYNHPTVLNFYKVLEDGETKKGGAKFTLSYSDNGTTKYVKVKSSRATSSGLKGCYIYDSTTTTASEASKLIANTDTSSGYDISEGEVCVIKLPTKTYTATETDPLDYHTFGDSVTKTFVVNNSSTERKAMSNDRKYTNYRTEFEFTKTVADESSDPDIQAITTAELKEIPFAIYDNNNNKVDVIATSTPGVYEYAHNNVDGISGTSTQELHLNDNRKIKVYHLPVGKYTIREEDCCCESSCTSPSSNTCYGYYAPKYSESTKHLYEFEITRCSSPSSATDISSCSPGIVTKQLENVPTKVEFTKSDFYSYVDPHETVQFENDEERSAFDEITFKVYYLEGNVKHYVKLLRTGDTGSCKTDSSHSNYRYIADQTRSDLTEEIHTCGGHIEITHLCRGRDWYIEEVSVSGKSVFILPETEEERTVKVELDCCNETSTPRPSETVQINDKPTRVVFEKRDSKYGNLINDETTTFEVYRCAEGTTCHPGDYDTAEERIAAGMTLVKYNSRGVITNDEEDPNIEVYRAVTNINEANNPVTSLHPYQGKLVFRYMESGFNYVLLETVAPKGYKLPTGRDAESPFTISTETVQVEEIDVPNKPTSILIKKYDDNGNLLEGAEFKIYETSTCGGPVKPKDKDKTLLTLKTIRDGIYENREVKDTDTLITCTDKPGYKCSDMVTTLTLDKYTDTFVDFDRSVNQNNQRVEITAGEILVQYLFYGKCYIIEEVKAPKGYSLPEDENDRFVEIEIKPESDVVDTGKDLVNKPTPFTFYKFDEYNNLIDGGEFKLQKLNQNKKYEDLTVTEEELNGKLYYKVDPTSTNKVIKTRNGEATVYYLEEGQYRIVETKAPEGMELPKKEINVAVFYVDEDGRVIGNSIITNKPKTEKITIKPTASAELIVNISTGIDRIKYGLIIGAIVVVLGGLIVFRLKALNKAKKD